MITKEYISKKAADKGFAAAYCCAPDVVDGVPESVKTLVLLLRAYQPHDDLVDAFYIAKNESYDEAGKMLLEIVHEREIGVHMLSNHRLKPFATERIGLSRGMNTLNYHAEFGSKFCMELIGLEEEIEGETLPESKAALSCANCGRCMQACPGGAITSEGFIKEKCIRFYMMSGKPIPEHLRPFIGAQGGSYAVIGCDVCQRVCPGNAEMEKLRSKNAQAPFTLEELLTCNQATLEYFGALYGHNYANRNRILSQAALAAGNSGDEKYLPVLEALTRSPSATVSEHARWAVENLQKSKKNY